MNRAVFLDRDGTINEEMGYINHVKRFRLFEFVPDAIKIFNSLEYKVIVVTNQSGLGRGYFDEQLLDDVHKTLIRTVSENGGVIDRIYYCPHHPTEAIEKYRMDCNCRKPKTGMIDRAREDFNIDIKNSFMIGDRFKDVEFGKKVGLRTIMVLTGYGLGEYTFQKKDWPYLPDHVADNLLEAAKIIKKLV
ncbi:MAG: D-glycero-alpha-D-manno-heptose-1,7-bisphosphate 7-phosphatase [Calditrichaceae bacterium]